MPSTNSTGGEETPGDDKSMADSAASVDESSEKLSSSIDCVAKSSSDWSSLMSCDSYSLGIVEYNTD
eukprot:scaffold148457_cov31-Cyclotella_meneghiniana.AAC.1